MNADSALDLTIIFGILLVIPLSVLVAEGCRSIVTTIRRRRS